MEVSNLAAFDDHICVYCRCKINGLSNYIEHLKACEPFYSSVGTSIPRLPFLRTPSRESLQSEVESLAESRCSSLDSYTQRIYDDMHRFEKEVLGCDPEAPCREELKNEYICEESGNDGCTSTRGHATSCVESSSRNTQEMLEERLRKLSVDLDPSISQLTVANSMECVTKRIGENVINELRVSSGSGSSEQIVQKPDDSMISRSDDNVSKKSHLSVSSHNDKNEGRSIERTSSNMCPTGQFLSGISSPNKMLGNNCECDLGCLDNVAPSAGIDTVSIDKNLESTQKDPANYVKVGPTHSSPPNGVTMSTDGGIEIYKIWGDTPELLVESLRDCLLMIFCPLSLADRKKVFDEVERLCACYTSSAGTIQLKIIKAFSKMNLLIKKMEDVEESDSVKVGENGMTAERTSRDEENCSNMAASSSTGESLPKMRAECAAQRICERDIGCESVAVDASVPKFVERKENMPTAAPVPPENVCEPSKEDYLSQKTSMDTTALSTEVSEESILRDENVTKTENNSKLEPCNISLKEATCGDLVASNSRSDATKVVYGDEGSLINTETLSSVLNPHFPKNVLPNTPKKYALKGATDLVFKGVQNPSVICPRDDSLKISKDNVLANCTSRMVIQELNNIPNATMISQKNDSQNKETVAVDGESGNALEQNDSQQLLPSPGYIGKQLKSSMAASPWHEIADSVFFSSVEDVGLEVEVGSDETGSFISEDSQMQKVSSLLIPLQLMQTKAVRAMIEVTAAKGLTRQCRTSRGRGKRSWRKVHRVRESIEGSSEEQFVQEDILPKTMGNGSRRMIGSSTMYTRNIAQVETSSDSVKMDMVTRMGLQRYHLRIKQIEGCKTAVSPQVFGENSVESSSKMNKTSTKESQALGAEFSDSRSLVEIVEDKMHYRGGSRTGVRKSLSVAEEAVHNQEYGQVQAIVHSKETKLDPRDFDPVLMSDATSHSMDQKKSYQKSRRGFAAKNMLGYFRKRRKKRKTLFVMRKVHHKKKGTSRNTGSPSSDMIESGPSLCSGAKALPASNVSNEDVDLQQKRSNAPCPDMPVHNNSIERSRRQKWAVSEAANGRHSEEKEKTGAAITEGLPKTLDSSCTKLELANIKRCARAAEGGLDPTDAAVIPEAQIPLSASRTTTSDQSLSNRVLRPINTNASIFMDSQSLEEVVNSESKKLEVLVNPSKSNKIGDIKTALDSALNSTGAPRLHKSPRCYGKRSWKQAEMNAVNIADSSGDEEGLELVKTLKPLSIDLGFRCDSKEFLSHLHNEDFVGSNNAKQDKNSRILRSHSENGKRSARSKISSQLGGDENESGTKRKRFETDNQKLSVEEEMPVLFPEVSIQKEDPKISHGCERKNSHGPKLINKVIGEVKQDKRKPFQMSSIVTDNDEVQVVLECIRPHKDYSLQKNSHINRIKTEAVTGSKQCIAEKKNSPISLVETLRGRISSAHLIMGKRLVSSKKEIENDIVKVEGHRGNLNVHEPGHDIGLLNIMVTDVRSGAELTEEERNIPLNKNFDNSVKTMRQISNCNELNEILADPKMERTDVDRRKEDDFLSFSRKGPDVVSPSKLSPSKKIHSTMEKYIEVNKSSYGKVSKLRRSSIEGQCDDESIRVEKVIPLITLHETNVAESTNQSKPLKLPIKESKLASHNTNETENLKQPIDDSKPHQIEDRCRSDANPAPNPLTCNSIDSILQKETLPCLVLSSVELCGATVIPEALCGQLGQGAQQSSDLKSSEVHSISVQSNAQGKIVFQFGDKNKLIEFLKLQKLGHYSSPPNQEAATVKLDTSGDSIDLAQHQLIKLGEIVSHDQGNVKEELNILAKSLGMKILLTQPGKNQLGKFILYNVEEKSSVSDIIRVDYCKGGQMKQKS